MDRRIIAETLSSQLRLETPPVALAFVSSPPMCVELFEQAVPSACTLWRLAESRTFYAPPEAHYNCPIGAMTMGFELPEPVREQLMGVFGKMCGCGYVLEAEADKIPSVTKSKQGIVYGPLESFPIDPDLILLWLTPRQAMLYGEAVGSCRWTNQGTTLFGRPACAAMAVASEKAEPASSLGCMGMRTFTEIDDERLFAVVPGQRLDEFAEALRATVAANETMREFYAAHKAVFSA